VGVAVDVGKFVLNVFVPVNAFVPASVTSPPPYKTSFIYTFAPVCPK
jgi:hypothetical protein